MIRPRRLIVALMLLLVVVAWPLTAGAQQKESGPSPVASLLDPSQLATLRTDVARVGMFSSYDRSGGNDDGFSGKQSFVRKEADDRLVLAEVDGPGAITRIWTPTPTNAPIEFFFDGEEKPRLVVPFADLFRGRTPPFVGPTTYTGAGGYVTYAPLTFEKSIKVVARTAKVQFYQINYVRFEPGTAVRTFARGDREPVAEFRPVGRVNETAQTLQPGGSATLFLSSEPGRVVGFEVSPLDALAGPERAIVLRITYDGAERPAVEVPAGDFFGASFGKPSVRSMLLGATNQNVGYATFPIPYNRSIRIDLVDQRTTGAPINVKARILTTATARQPSEAYFHASWRREAPTTPGQPFTFVDLSGRGHLVGVTLQAQGTEPGQTLFFEGDDQTTIDGELVAHGTGSEDFFNGGWYDLPGRWYQTRSFPLSGCLEYKKALGRTGAYRLFLGDALVFRKSLLLTIEHGPEKNAVPTDYTGVSYYYLDQAGGVGPALPDAPARRATPPTSFVIVPGWQAPIHAFSLDDATLSRVVERIGGKSVRTLTLRDQGTPDIQGHYVAITAEPPEAGRYRIEVEGVRGPDEGILQLFVDDQPVGQPVDFYAPERSVSEPQELATIELAPAGTPLYFTLVGKNDKSSGRGFALVRIVCTPVAGAP
jgi:hypothetical protein